MANEPVYMLNMLWFDAAGGAEKCQDYLAGAGSVVARLGGGMLNQFKPVEALQGDFDPDLTFVIRWPSIDAFRGLIAEPDYQAIAHLRGEAIERAVLTRCEAVT